MVSLKEIKDIITDDKLNVFFLKREEELNTLTPEERKKSSERVKEYKIDYNNILNAINNVPPCFEETRKNIIKTIEKYLEKNRILQSYDNERFYKVGFCDAIAFILEGKNLKR